MRATCVPGDTMPSRSSPLMLVPVEDALWQPQGQELTWRVSCDGS